MLGHVTFAIVFGLILLLMINEYINIFSKGTPIEKWQKILAIITGLSLFIAIFSICNGYTSIKILMLPLLLTTSLFITSIFIKRYNTHNISYNNTTIIRDSNGYEVFPAYIASIIYIAVPISLLNFVDLNFILCFFIIIWTSDVGAYCFGSTLGQKYGPKLFPSISPKKSWIGVFGGVICSIIAGLLLSNLTTLFDYKIIDTIIISAIISIGGVIGDLVESQLKRNFAVKDSGNLMPGHGGYARQI
jgi:CDP-diglyceride synthetase